MGAITWASVLEFVLGLIKSAAAAPLQAAIGSLIAGLAGAIIVFFIKRWLAKIDKEAAQEQTEKEHDELVNDEIVRNEEKNKKDAENKDKLEGLN